MQKLKNITDHVLSYIELSKEILFKAAQNYAFFGSFPKVILLLSYFFLIHLTASSALLIVSLFSFKTLSNIFYVLNFVLLLSYCR